MALTVCGVVSLHNVKTQSLQFVLLGLGLLQPGLAQDRAVQSLELTVAGQTTPPAVVTQLEAGEHIVQCMAIGFSPWNLRLNFTMWAQPSGRGQPRGITVVTSDSELSRLAGSVLYRASQYFAIQVKSTTTSLSCYEDNSFKGPPVTTTLDIYKCSLQWVEAALNDNPRPDATFPSWYFRHRNHDTIRCEASLFCGASTLSSVPHPIQFEVWLDKEKLDIPPVTDVRIHQRWKGVQSVDIGFYDVQQNFSTNFTKKEHGKNVTCIETITGVRSRFTLMLCDPPDTTTTTTTSIIDPTSKITTKDDKGELNIRSSKGRRLTDKSELAIWLTVCGCVAVLGLASGLFVFSKTRGTRVEPVGVAWGPQAPGGSDTTLPAATAVTVSETTEYDVPITSKIATPQAGKPNADV